MDTMDTIRKPKFTSGSTGKEQRVRQLVILVLVAIVAIVVWQVASREKTGPRELSEEEFVNLMEDGNVGPTPSINPAVIDSLTSK